MSRFFVLLLAGIPLLAQTYTGNISGRVTDPTGAVLPGTKVTVTETATNTVVKTEANSTGDYIVSFLKPGVYSVGFSATGFKEYVQTGLTLQLNQALRVDAAMQVGDVSQKLEVSATAEQVNYSSPEIGHVVGEQQLQNLPLLSTANRGRSPLLLAKLVPGVTSTSQNNSNINNFSFGGGRPVSNEILVDGLPTTNPSDNTYTLTPSPDSVQEFKVITTPFSAEWGHTGGGVMLLTTKSGTNDFHGYLYDLFRNRVLNARNFFAADNLQKYVQNNPGITIGGPVLIPKLYNGRNKTFFYVDWNVTLSSIGDVYSQLVPTDLEKSGDFSQSAGGKGQPVQIYDPASVTQNPDGSFSRELFPGAKIPSSRIDPVAARIVSYYPSPNGSFNGNNYSIHPPQGQQVWQTIERLDHYFSDRDRMMMRYGHYSPNADAHQYIPNNANNDNASGWLDNQFVISETHVLTPTLFNDFRAGFVQEVNYDKAGGGPAPSLGLKGVPLDFFPIIQTDQFIQLGANPSDRDRDRSWVFSEAMTWQRGRHTLKFGGDFRRQMYNYYAPGLLAGGYAFSSVFTANPQDGSGGFSLADLLLGMPVEAQVQSEDYTYRLNINSAAAYFQDDFKVSPTLTLNLGLRWEFAGPYSEANNQFGSFSPTLINPQTGTPGTVQFAGRDGAPRHFSPNIYHNFLPRIGFAWNFMSRTVIRSGYGIYRLPSIGYSNYGPISQYVVNATFQSPDGGITPPFTLAGGVPPYSYNVDANGNPSIPASLTDPSSDVVSLDRRVRTPYNQTFQIGLERQFSSSWFGEVDYVATKGTKLPIEVPLDQIPYQLWGPNATYLDRPFPQYTSVTGLMNDGNSMYHSLQAKLDHRWNNGLLISLAYTFSKLIDDVDPPNRVSKAWIQDAYNLRAERGIAGYDIPQRFVANYIYQLPFGRGGRYLSDTSVLRNIIGGWQLAGLTEMQVGLPLHVSQPNTTHAFNDQQRPNQIAPVQIHSGNLRDWFSTDSFSLAAPYTVGNAARYPFHGPGINNTDLSIMRNFRFSERYNLQFRGELYNAFNHAQFDPKSVHTGLTDSRYGQVTGALSARIAEFAIRLFF